MLNMFPLPVVGIFALSGMVGSTRIKRDDCNSIMEKFQTCTHAAYNDYSAAFIAGDDGRPEWMARKSCNYMTAAVEDCGNLLIGDCNTAGEVTMMKDHQLKGILVQLQSSVQEWDSEKCPPVKAHIVRMKGEEDGTAKQAESEYEEVATVEVGKQESPEYEEIAEPSEIHEPQLSNGSGSSTLSLLLVTAVFMTLFCTSC